VRTVQRWEKSEGLPVYRHIHKKLGTVYAYASELDAWWNNRRPRLEAEEAQETKEAGKKWRRWMLAAALAGLAIAVATGLLLRQPVLPFEERDWVLIASFENRTGEALFDGTLEYALERELSNSGYVSVVPRERVEDVLRLMKRPLNTKIDAALGREICLRDGEIRALLAGSAEKIGPAYLLSVALVDPYGSTTVAGFNEEVASHEAFLPALQRLSKQVRKNLGENPFRVRFEPDKLEKVTTPSLQALQLYSQADLLIDQGKSAFPAWEYWVHGNMQKALEEVDRVAESVGDRRGQEREGFAFLVGLHYLPLGRFKQAQEMFDYIRDTSALQWCPALAAFLRDDSEALNDHLRRFTSEPRPSFPIPLLLLIRAGFLSEADEMTRAIEKSPWRRTFPALRGELSFARGQSVEAIPLLEEGIRKIRQPLEGITFFFASESLASAHERQGQLDKALRVLEQASQIKNELGVVLGPTAESLWMRNQWRLAQVYRKLGREEDAQPIEAELLKRLAYADSDHPILQALSKSPGQMR
jgi:tetratricopeptide (TPR) repeat protein